MADIQALEFNNRQALKKLKQPYSHQFYFILYWILVNAYERNVMCYTLLINIPTKYRN